MIIKSRYARHMTRYAQFLLPVLALLLLVACGGDESLGEMSDLAQTATALAGGSTTSEEPAAEAGVEVQDGETPEPPPPAEEEIAPVEPEATDPTAPEVEGQSEVDELAAAATALAVELEATAAAVAAAEAETAAAKEAQEAPIRAELATYGVTDGQLTHIYDPITLEENQFEGYAYEEPTIAAKARDFVVAADITWNSRFGESGCGFAVRSNGNPDSLSQYLVGLTRGAEGHVLFAEQVEGNVDLDLVTDIFPRTHDPQFQWQNDTTNRIAIVGRGQSFTIYSNGSELGTINANSGLEDGFVAFFALNRSGGVRCIYENAWLWEMN